MSFGVRGAVFGLASTVEAGLVLAEVIGLAGASGEALELIIFRKI